MRPSTAGPERTGREQRWGLRELILVFGFWTLYGTVMAVNLLVSPLRQTSPPTSLVAFTYLGAYAWALLTVPVFWMAERISRGPGSFTSRLVQHLALGFIVSALVSTTIAVASSILLDQLQGGTLSGPRGMWEIARYRYLNDLLACLLIIVAGIAREYFLRHQARQREASALREQLVAARLETLRTQLNPHFLFNTLNSVSALVALDPKGVRRMVELLSEMLRYTLDGASEPEITVREELRIVERYLEILEIRYGGRLSFSIHADPDVEQALVPNLILQPLAENAIKHGVGPAGGRGRIEVEARREGDSLVMQVRDTGHPSVAPIRAQGGGMGLSHTRERLSQIYGATSSLRLLRDEEEGGTTAEVRLPFHLETVALGTPERRRLTGDG